MGQFWNLDACVSKGSVSQVTVVSPVTTYVCCLQSRHKRVLCLQLFLEIRDFGLQRCDLHGLTLDKTLVHLQMGLKPVDLVFRTEVCICTHTDGGCVRGVTQVVLAAGGQDVFRIW